MTKESELHVLMVCLGNICRSPTAHGVMEKKLEAAGLSEKVKIDSAGTADYHVGEAPDLRSQEYAAKRGYDLSALSARQVAESDFDRFDYILAMDSMNMANLCRMCPPEQVHKLHMLLDFANADTDEVPDPYHGGDDGFDDVLDLVEAACDGFLLRLRADLDGRS